MLSGPASPDGSGNAPDDGPARAARASQPEVRQKRLRYHARSRTRGLSPGGPLSFYFNRLLRSSLCEGQGRENSARALLSPDQAPPGAATTPQPGESPARPARPHARCRRPRARSASPAPAESESAGSEPTCGAPSPQQPAAAQRGAKRRPGRAPGRAAARGGPGRPSRRRRAPRRRAGSPFAGGAAAGSRPQQTWRPAPALRDAHS